MQLLEGTLVSKAIKDKLKKNVDQLLEQGKKRPHLAAVLIGNDGASETYVNAKIKACGAIGFTSTLLRFDEKISEKYLLDQINLLNENNDVDGFLVQLPLPRHINPELVINSIDPGKDVDGFHPINIGKMVNGLPAFIPATPYGITLMMQHYKVPTDGKHCVVLGRSHIVGTPMSILMSRNAYPGNCTVTLCHSHTEYIKDYCRSADILIIAIGKPAFVTADMVKEGATVIDVGTTRIPDETKKSGFRLQGDVKFDEVAPKCNFITPVPKGVGPMTIAALLKNTYHAAISQKGRMN